MFDSLLICDDDASHTATLAACMCDEGWTVEIAPTYREAWEAACAIDFGLLMVAPFMEAGSALALPTALGIRRPPLVVLATTMFERIDDAVVRSLGFDLRLTKVIDAQELIQAHRHFSERRRRLSAANP